MFAAALTARLPRSFVPGGVSSIVPGPRSGYARLSNQIAQSRTAHGRAQQPITRTTAGRPIPRPPKYTPGNVASNPGTAVSNLTRRDPFVQYQPGYGPPGSPSPAPAPRAAAPTRAARPSTPAPSRIATPRPAPRGVPRAAAIGGGVLGAIDGTIAAGQALQAGATPAQAIAIGGGVAAGSTGGTYAGALVGAAIGSAIAPGIGTAIGGYVGGAIGGLLGGRTGGALGNALAALLPGRDRTPVTGDHAVSPTEVGREPGGPPFLGGQGYGVLYLVCAVGVHAGGPNKGQQGEEVCMSFGSVRGPVTGIVNFEGTLEQWRPTSSHPVHAADGGMVALGFGINAYSAEIGSLRITRFIRLDGVSAETDRQMYGDPPPVAPISPTLPRANLAPALSPTAPLWGGAAAPQSVPSAKPTPPPPAPIPVGDPVPSQAPALAPAPAPTIPGLEPRTTPPPPAVSRPAQPVSVGRGATAGVFQPVPLADFATRLRETFPSFEQRLESLGTFQDRVNEFGTFSDRLTEFGTFGDRVVDLGTFGDRLRGLEETALLPSPAEAAAIAGATAALAPLPRGARAPLGTAISFPRPILNPLTSTVAPPASLAPRTQTPTNTGCRCNGPVLAALGNLSGTGVGPNGTPTSTPSNGAQNATLAAILAKLQQMQAFAEKAWRSTQAQKILDVLTFIGVMHNAAFLSREVAETMSYMVGNVLNIFGIEDENGSNLDVFGWLGDTINGFFVKVFGQDLVDDVRESWKKASAILRSASMIIWTVRSIFDSTQELLEWIGENTGKIGNALKRWGVIGFNAYPWMAERVASQDRVRRRYKRILDGLETAEDTSSSFAMATGEVISIQEEIGELGEQRQAFNASVRDLTEGAEPDNSAIPTAGDEGVSNAQAAPEVSAADFEPGNPP